MEVNKHNKHHFLGDRSQQLQARDYLDQLPHRVPLKLNLQVKAYLDQQTHQLNNKLRAHPYLEAQVFLSKNRNNRVPVCLALHNSNNRLPPFLETILSSHSSSSNNSHLDVYLSVVRLNSHKLDFLRVSSNNGLNNSSSHYSNNNSSNSSSSHNSSISMIVNFSKLRESGQLR